MTHKTDIYSIFYHENTKVRKHEKQGKVEIHI